MWLTAYTRQRQNAPTYEEVIDTLAEYIYKCRFPTRNGDILTVLPKLVEDTFQSRELLDDANIVVKGYMLKSEPRIHGDPKSAWMRILTHFEVLSPSVSLFWVFHMFKDFLLSTSVTEVGLQQKWLGS